MPNSRSTVDMRFFDQPGYDELFDAWSEVFTQEAAGEFILDPSEALARVALARRIVRRRFGHEEETLTTLEQIACRNARIWQDELAEMSNEGAL